MRAESAHHRKLKACFNLCAPLPNRPVESGFQPAILFYSGSRALPEATMNEAFGLAGSTRQRRRLIVGGLDTRLSLQAESLPQSGFRARWQAEVRYAHNNFLPNFQTWHACRVNPAMQHIAYFSMEIGLDPAIHTYAGGLGILAGDTLKSAADLKLPMVGVSLLYREGHFRQSIETGKQREEPQHWDFQSIWSGWTHGVRCAWKEGRCMWARGNSPIRV